MTSELHYLYKDDELVVVNKPSGVLVHPDRSQRSSGHTLMTYVRDDLGKYVYPIHRLDRPVSGCTVFALSKKSARTLKENWHNDETHKVYLALCFGQTPLEGIWDDPLKGKRGERQWAKTEFQRLYEMPGFEDLPSLSLVKIQIHSGRKHQIRRHFAHHHFPLVGDLTYGKERWNQKFRDGSKVKGFMLHAFCLSFVHPQRLEKVQTRAQLPAHFLHAFDALLKDDREVLEIIGNQRCQY